MVKRPKQAKNEYAPLPLLALLSNRRYNWVFTSAGGTTCEFTSLTENGWVLLRLPLVLNPRGACVERRKLAIKNDDYSYYCRCVIGG